MKQRSGLTLVEMLVAMALCLFIMAIMSEAFVAGLDSFRQLKAMGDMNTKLRGAVTVIRNDLQKDHFGDQPLSKQTLPPTQGFFRLFHGSPPTLEGVDADGIPSYRATDQMLHFTVNLSLPTNLIRTVNRPDNFLSTPVSGSSPLVNLGPAAFQDGTNYFSQWAEVAYFLRPTGRSSNGTDPLPLYTLHRRQLLAYVPESGQPDLNSGLNRVLSGLLGINYTGVSTKPDPLLGSVLYFNTPEDLTIPARRFGMQTPPFPFSLLQPQNAGLLNNGTYPAFEDDPSMQAFAGSDVLLTDVVSFEVRASTGGAFLDLFDSTLQPLMKNPAFRGAGDPRIFDTWSQKADLLWSFAGSIWSTANTYKSLPLNVNVQAVQVTIRIWDPKSQKTRQVTMVQDM